MTPSRDFEKRIDNFKELIANSKKIVFIGGAGVSTESGIKDFRSEDGLYNEKEKKVYSYIFEKPEELLSHGCICMDAAGFFSFYRDKLDCRGYEPNITHKTLARLEKEGKDITIITQNIDGLHQQAGSTKVLEIHGTTKRNYCSKCGKEYDADYIFENTERIPMCDCGGVIRPDVVLYEENVKYLTEAIGAMTEADLVIIGGTSLNVYPANSLTSYTNDAKIVICNMQETSEDRFADIVFHEKLGEVFSRI